MSFPKVKIPKQIVNGVMLLDKPVGFSSNDALRKVKGMLNAKKGGHTGTLDPFATGLLPLCFGEATKFSQDLLNADKTYETLVYLGKTTTTGDSEGEVTSEQEVSVTPAQIEAALAQFRGEISQIPPMYSALKRDGKPLYEYARAGVTLEREARQITIHELELLDYTAPNLRLRVHCSKGTYVRVLGEDIGKVLGCGAYLTELRRTQIGHVVLNVAEDINTLADLSQEERKLKLQPVDSLLSTFPKISLNVEMTTRFMHGQRLPLNHAVGQPYNLNGRVRVYREEDGVLLGTGQMTPHGVLSPERLVNLG